MISRTQLRRVGQLIATVARHFEKGSVEIGWALQLPIQTEPCSGPIADLTKDRPALELWRRTCAAYGLEEYVR